jgi:tetratricopeptide (TPR) repeat protein
MLAGIGDIEARGVALSGLALLANIEGDPDEAIRLYEEARTAFAAIGDRPEVARVLDEMAWCILGSGATERARSLFLASLREHDSIGSPRGVGLALMGLAAAEVAEDRLEEGLVVSAAADAFSEKEGVVVSYPWVFAARERLEEAISGLPADLVARLTERGRGLSAQQAIAFVTERARSGAAA